MSRRGPHTSTPWLLSLSALLIAALAASFVLIPGRGVAADEGAPTVTAVDVTSDAGDDDTYALGETITITVTFSEAVDVTGTPQLKIDMDPAEWGTKVVDYASGSGAASLTFDHTVVEPNYSTGGIAVLANSLALNGGTIRSASSQTAADLSHARREHDPEHKVDWTLAPPAPTLTPKAIPKSVPTPTPAPSVTGVSVSSAPASNDTYALGETIRVTLTFSEAVDVTGSPRLKIDMDPAAWGEKWAAYSSGSGTTGLTFAHTVVEPNLSRQGIAVLANSLALNGGTIRSASSQTAADLSHAKRNHDPEHKVDWRQAAVPPTTRDASESTDLQVSISASPAQPLMNETATLSAVISNAPQGESPSYNWEIETDDEWSTFGTNATLSFMADKSESWTFRVTVSYGNGDSATSDPLTVLWLNPNNRAPVVNTEAGHYESFTSPRYFSNLDRGLLVSKPFHQVFTDPDGDELTYSVSIPDRYRQLLDTFAIGPEKPQGISNPEVLHRIWFRAEDDTDWKAISPALPDPVVVTATLTATDLAGLSVSLDGHFSVNWDSYPEVVSATASGAEIELTFDVAVEDDPKPAASQFTVNVANPDGTAGTIAVNGVSVKDKVVTLDLASAPQPDQTVTLDYAHDADAPLKRAADGGDSAPGFTGQAVTQPPSLDLRLSPGTSAHSITASWNPLPDATSQNLRWRRSGADTEQWNSLDDLPGDQSSADFDVETSGLYDVSLESLDPQGRITSEANQVNVRVTARYNAVMGSPTNPSFYSCQPRAISGFQVVFTNNGVELSWDDPGVSAIDKYIIQLTEGGSLTMGPTRPSDRTTNRGIRVNIGGASYPLPHSVNPYNRWSDVPGSNAGTTLFTLTGLALNQTYGAWINAVDTRGDDDASNDRYYCMGEYAFIKTFDVNVPAITGLEAYSGWYDGPEQATLEWDNHGKEGLSYEYQFDGVPVHWADSFVRGMPSSRTGVIPPEQVSVGRDGKLYATISGLSCDYNYFRIWLRAKDGASYGPRQVVNYVYLGRTHDDNTRGERSADWDHKGECVYGWGGNDTLHGGESDDIMSGGSGDDELYGRGGDDWLHGGSGGDLLDGGPGSDTASYAGWFAVNVNLADGTALYGDAAGDRLVSIENLTGSNHADTLTGNDGDNVLEGGGGGDNITGGGGNDTASYARSRAAVTVNLGSASECRTTTGSTVAAGFVGGGDAAGDTLTGIENLTGSDHADILCADDGDNVITGGGGFKIVSGEVIGDGIVCGGGNDTLDYSDSPAAITVDLASAVGFGGDADGDYFPGFTGIITDCENVTGSNHDDTLKGSGAANVLRGGGGNDTLLDTGAGSDILYGGPGDDSLTGNNGDTLYGGTGDDALTSDDIVGGARLTGGPGDDTLTLEAVRDTGDPATNELYFHMGFDRDTVTNFVLAHDTIYLCGMEGVSWTGLPTSDGYRIWVDADETIFGRTYSLWSQGSITLVGVTLPYAKDTPPGGLKIVTGSCETPVVQSASVNGASLTITFDGDLDTGSKPADSAFTVKVNGTVRTLTSGGVNISGRSVTLTLSSAVTAGQTVTVSYTAPTTNPLRHAGHAADSFTDRPVTNSTP